MLNQRLSSGLTFPERPAAVPTVMGVDSISTENCEHPTASDRFP